MITATKINLYAVCADVRMCGCADVRICGFADVSNGFNEPYLLLAGSPLVFESVRLRFNRTCYYNILLLNI